MPRKPVQDNVDREQFDLLSIGRVKRRVGECEKLPLDVRSRPIALLSEGARLIEDHGYGVRTNGAAKTGKANGKGNGKSASPSPSERRR